MKRKSSPMPMDVDGSSKRTRRGNGNNEFRSVKASIVLAVPPVFANRLHSGVEEMLDTMIMRCSTFSLSQPPCLLFIYSFSRSSLVHRRYEPTLNGVVLMHSNVHFLNRNARLQADSPFATCHVGFEALVWNPIRGMKLSASGYRIPFFLC
jgi:DNA-directed RNA polymerase I subunit RPA43